MILAQTTQEWVWSGIDIPRMLEHVALVAGLAAAAGVAVVYAVFKVVNVIIEQIGGAKKLWREKVEDDIRTVAQAASPSIPTTPEIEAKVNQIASGDK